MIKELIKDIAYDKINLSQALTRAKITAAAINNTAFIEWLKNEIEGYKDESLPPYRKIYAPVRLVAEFPYNNTQIIDVNLPEYLGDKAIDIANHYKVYDSIANIEDNINSIKESEWRIELSYDQVEAFHIIYLEDVQKYGGVIRKGYRLSTRTNFTNIIDSTKQRLLDTLMELDKEFPNLEANYEKNTENDKVIKTIVNNHIYASNNNINNAIGPNSSIASYFSTSLSEIQERNLKDLGVMENDIAELNTILKENNKEKPEFGKKLIGWCSSVASSLAGRGLYDAIPKINEFIHQLL